MIPFRSAGLPEVVPEKAMSEVYEKLKTPYKYGAVCIRDDEFTDSPSVFRLNGKWYMMYLTISKDCDTSGYSTWLSESDDLVNWKPMFSVLERNGGNNWDSKQIAGYLGLTDIEWGRNNEPGKVKGSYLVSYLGGNFDGYEPVPLHIGLAYTNNLFDPKSYSRINHPILSPFDDDCREGERLAMYRSFIFEDSERVTGYPYVLAYNAKGKDYRERIFLAVSKDAINWMRYGNAPVLDGTVDNPDNKIVADGQIIKMGNLYVMVYFVLDYGKPAFSTFACSYDLVNWTPWREKPLIEAEYPWENEHAHKSWIVHHDGITYNYYCAVNSKNERFIALATSKEI